jgi:TonB family protein
MKAHWRSLISATLVSLSFHFLVLYFLEGDIDSRLGGGAIFPQTVFAVDLAPVSEGESKGAVEDLLVDRERGVLKGTDSSVYGVEVSAVSSAGGLPRKVDYVPSRELTQRAMPVAPVIVPFPDAVSGKWNGAVLLQLELSEQGDVDAVKIVESDLPDSFGEIARKVFQAARFHPGIKDGRAVPVRMKLEVRFSDGA